MVSQLAPELKDMLCTAMKEVVRDVVERSMASRGKTGLDVGVPLEVHNAIDGWTKKYRKRQENGHLDGRSHIKKKPSAEQSM